MRTTKLLIALVSIFFVAAVNATPLSFWNADGWTMVDDDDGVGNGGYVNPGWGGQNFDAEYLYYRVDGNILSLGIQAGYDLVDGIVTQSGHTYYGGDLALSFNGGGFDYAVDFGLKTKDYYGDIVEADNNNDGVDAAGLYSVSTWNNDIYFNQSAPFAMDAGSFISGLLSNNAGYNSSLDTYFRTVSIDLGDLGLGNSFDFLMHWTMSCGNDMVEGGASVSVPEPGTIALFSLGILGLIWSRKRVIS